MIKFIELRRALWDGPTSNFAKLQRRIHSENRYAAETLPLAVADSQLTPWNLGDAVPDRGLWLLIGVADGNLHDLRLLDVVSDHLMTSSIGLAVKAINVTGFPNDDRLRHVLSSVEPAIPLVSFWRDRRCERHTVGWAGRSLVEEVLGPIYFG